MLQFSSPIFLYLFLPIFFAGYWLIANRLRSIYLLGASFFFYAWGEGRYVVLLLVLILVNYSLGLLAERFRETVNGTIAVWLAIAINLGVLFWYKYSTFFVTSLKAVVPSLSLSSMQLHDQHLPLGISFLAFQSIAYVVDVYRADIASQRSFVRFGVFMSLFPKIAAGPIIRYGDVADDIAQHKIDLDLFSAGIKRFVIGLGKKVLLADTLALTSTQVFAIQSQDLTPGVAWLGIVCYTLQLYFDFSGYSDMAIGLGRMVGIRIPENFDYPYIARSLSDFWRRWHISLSTWLRDYLFIPLSYSLMTEKVRQKIALGSYKKNYRSAFSIFIVFTLCGLWHGAGYNFIAWGMFHGIILGIESLWLGKIIKKWHVAVQHVYLMSLVMTSWVFFRVPSVKGGISYLLTMLGVTSGNSMRYHLSLYLNPELVLVLLAGTIGALPVAGLFSDLCERKGVLRGAGYVQLMFLCLVLIVSMVSLANTTFTPFIYQKF